MAAGGYRGVAVFAATALAGATAIAAALHALHLAVGDNRANAFIVATMWVPAFARVVATSTVDRGWRSPFPVSRWGYPRLAVLLVPLAIVCAIYLGAYALAWSMGIARETPAWQGRKAINIVVNLPLLTMFGVVGSLGEELGWRGYLQPRLDELDVRGSLLWVIAIETLFHVPLILLAGYLEGGAPAMTIALFLCLGLGLTPVWTWATYRWRSIWIAAWFHTFHNAVSQVILPKSFGAGSPLILGESGLLPVALYLAAAGVVFGGVWARGEHWRDFARRTLREAQLPQERSPLDLHSTKTI